MALSIDGPSYQPSESVLFNELDGEVVILDCRIGTYYSLNPSGSRIWNWLTVGFDTNQIVERMVEAFGLSAGEAAGDLEPFVQSLEESELLVGVSIS